VHSEGPENLAAAKRSVADYTYNDDGRMTSFAGTSFFDLEGEAMDLLVMVASLKRTGVAQSPACFSRLAGSASYNLYEIV
jgi:hypothetical protein